MVLILASISMHLLCRAEGDEGAECIWELHTISYFSTAMTQVVAGCIIRNATDMLLLVSASRGKYLFHRRGENDGAKLCGKSI